MSEFPACFYRVSVKGVVSIEGKILLIREKSKRWDLPGGGVEHNEDYLNALRREFKEEIQGELDNVDVQKMEPWFMYDHDPDWKKPILYLVFPVTLDSRVELTNSNAEVGLFSVDTLKEALLEKHVEPYRESLIKMAFNND